MPKFKKLKLFQKDTILRRFCISISTISTFAGIAFFIFTSLNILPHFYATTQNTKLRASTKINENEIYQVIAFDWNSQTKKLTPRSTGSGKAINQNIILTNKHVVHHNNKTADLILLCKAKTRKKSNQKVTCDIPAAVTEIHPTLDAAIIKPLNNEKFPKTAIGATLKSHIGDKIKLYGFPAPIKDIQNFGSKKVLEQLKNWTKKGGDLKIKGENLTITRGRITGYSNLQDTKKRAYYITNAKGNLGISGGAAFNSTGKYIGIPTLINKNKDTYILKYLLIKDWIKAASKKEPTIHKEIAHFYEKHINKQRVKKRKTTKIQNQYITINTKPKTIKQQKITKTEMDLIIKSAKRIPMVEIIKTKNCEQTKSTEKNHWKCQFKVTFNNPYLKLGINMNNANLNKSKTQKATTFIKSNASYIGSNGQQGMGSILIETNKKENFDHKSLSFPIYHNREIITSTTPKQKKQKIPKHQKNITAIKRKHGTPNKIEKAGKAQYWEYKNGTKFFFLNGELEMWQI